MYLQLKPATLLIKIVIKNIAIIVIFSCILFFCNCIAFAQEAINNSAVSDYKFFGRKNYIKKLHNKLVNEDKVYIYGESGIGKTSLIKHYINLYCKGYDIVWWFNMKNNYELEKKSFIKAVSHKFFKNTDKDWQFDMLMKYLNEKSKKIFLIYDNAPLEYLKSIQDSLSNTNKIKFVFISNNFINNGYHIKALDLNESIEFIEYHLRDKEKKEDIENLANLTQGNPIFIQQSLAFILQSNLNNIRQYINLISKESANLLSKKPGDYEYTTNYDISPRKIIITPIEDIKKSNNMAFNILKFTSYLSNEVDESLMKLIFEIGNDNYSVLDYSQTMSFLLRLSQMNYDSKNQQYYLHTIKQKIIENEFSSIEDLNVAIKALIKLVENKKGSLPAFIENNPNIFDNMVILFKHSDKKKVRSKESFNLKVMLLNLYLNFYQYNEIDEVIKSIDEQIEANKMQDTEDLCLYFLLKGRYIDNKYSSYTKAIIYYQQALSLVNEIHQEDLKFLVYGRMANFLINYGKVNEVRAIMNKIEKEMPEYLRSDRIPYLPLYYGLKADLALEQLSYKKALEYKFKSLESFDSKNEKRKLLSYLSIAEILLKIHEQKDAYLYIEKCKNILKSEGEIYNDSKMAARYYILQANYSLVQNNIEYAEEQIKIAEESIEKISIQYSKEKSKDQTALINLVKSKLESIKGNQTRSIEYLFEAEKIYLLKYSTVELRLFSDVYYNIVKVSLENKDLYMANKYYKMHKDHFGQDDAITNKTRDMISVYELKNSHALTLD